MKEGIADDRKGKSGGSAGDELYIIWCKEDVSEGTIKGLTLKPTLGSQRDGPAELKSDRQRKWEQKRERDEEN